MKKWFVTMKKADFEGNAKKYGISPVLARLIRNRDMIEEKEIEQYLHGTLNELSGKTNMKDMEKGVSIIYEKIKEKKPIRIIGDYDIDGVNATYILLTGLELCGAKVDTDIPDRMKDGYGINEQLIEKAKKENIDTIITCDNGIAAINQIAYAKEQGMTVVITDHHDVPYEQLENGEKNYLLPPADAIINPKQEDCEYPFKLLCGAAVAYYFVEELLEKCGKPKDSLLSLVENVAIATVGDVVDLVGENRILVKTGLKMLEQTKNEGLKALIEVNGLNEKKLTAYHLGFVLGPCINASGRLDTAKRALELLKETNRAKAKELAGDLKALNDSRKELTLLGVKKAVLQAEEQTEKDEKVLVLYLPDCHESLAGIIAGRIREKYYKPVYVLTKGEEGAKGSGRSIEGYHMFDELTKCKELLTKYGGHPMAAGFSLPEENVEKFRERLNKVQEMTEEILTEKVSIDLQLPLEYITEDLVREMELLEPFGKGNPKPLFAEKELTLLNGRILGKNKNVLKLQLQSKNGTCIEAMYFGDIEQFLADFSSCYGEEERKSLEEGRRVKALMTIAFYPGINEYMGRKNLQLIVQNYIFN